MQSGSALAHRDEPDSREAPAMFPAGIDDEGDVEDVLAFIELEQAVE
jgi:hypothetical protein